VFDALPINIAKGSLSGSTSDFCATKLLDAVREIANTTKQTN